MGWHRFIWTDEDIGHLAEHDVTPEDFEHVVKYPDEYSVSHSSGLPCVFGYTLDGRYIIAVFEEIDDETVHPVTAYEVPEPRGRRKS